MTFFLNLYVMWYIITFININYFIVKYQRSNFSLNYLMIYIWKFSKLKTIIYILLLSLTGFPPFIFFFIKMNYIIHVISNINMFNIILIFLTLYSNIIFYIQIFFHKNTSLVNYFPKQVKFKLNFDLCFLTNFFIFFNCIGFFIFSDIFYIFSLLI